MKPTHLILLCIIALGIFTAGYAIGGDVQEQQDVNGMCFVTK